MGRHIYGKPGAREGTKSLSHLSNERENLGGIQIEQQRDTESTRGGLTRPMMKRKKHKEKNRINEEVSTFYFLTTAQRKGKDQWYEKPNLGKR